MNPTKTLQETVDLMLSDDWRDRFKAEYYQLEHRYIKLSEFLVNADLGKVEEAEQGANLHYRHEQLNGMRMYLSALRNTAKAEGIEL